MEDKNTPVQPDAVEATETRGRKVGAARFFELLGRDLWPFYKASILCVLGFAPGYAAVLFSTMAAVPAVRRCRRADCRTCFLRHAGYHPARSAR